MPRSTDFAKSLAVVYGAPPLDFTSLETAYRQLRDAMRGVFSPCMHEHRQALKRSARHRDYIAPGPNFILGATENEIAEDRSARKRAARADTALADAEAAMSGYDGWAQFKYVLAILTGRYDGSEFLGGMQSEAELKIVAEAFAIRRGEAPEEWRAALVKDTARRLEMEASEARLHATPPPDGWGRSLDPETRQTRWFSRPIEERRTLLACARA
jgi:hypothetical protein